MGDRANVRFKDEFGEIYLYTHWSGTELPETVRAALIRGESRWDDASYLARIIFSEMIKDSVNGTTGYGISTQIRDGYSRIITVDQPNRSVLVNGDHGLTFSEFVNSERGW